jgi:hypothetical protein
LGGNNAGKVKNAVEKLTKSLTASWWNSTGTAPGGNQGKKVFNELHDAIGALSAINGVPAVAQIVNDLMSTMDTWASDALAVAQVRGGNAGQINQSINNLALARTQRDQGNLTDAVDAYGKAWDSASKA